jgi:hypothetical protein
MHPKPPPCLELVQPTDAGQKNRLGNQSIKCKRPRSVDDAYWRGVKKLFDQIGPDRNDSLGERFGGENNYYLGNAIDT